MSFVKVLAKEMEVAGLLNKYLSMQEDVTKKKVKTVLYLKMSDTG